GGIVGIISFGMAGSLQRGLKIGHLVIGTAVDGPAPQPCDEDWAAALAEGLPGARRGPVYADGRLLATRHAKGRVSSTTAALTVDMESHVAAAAAARHGLPLAVLRCISDLHNVDLPPAVGVAMADGGGLAVGKMLGSLVRAPGQLPKLTGTLWQFSRGFSVLRDAVAELDASLAFDRRGQVAPAASPSRRRRRSRD
ncbi:MAG: hypothetical protein JSS36_08165, partial [Proteobacteria bacterium]|nr:hypothetical protein [Pseudomonadota bacterium]